MIFAYFFAGKFRDLLCFLHFLNGLIAAVFRFLTTRITLFRFIEINL